MINADVHRIAVSDIQSLVWENSTLVDWARGGLRIELNGTITSASVFYGYRFDAAVTSPSGEYAVLYERLGTKGILLRRGKVLREINRSYYQAEVYEFPVAVARLPDEREVLVHCPEEYNQLEIEEIATGCRLTISQKRKPCDFFHSRLVCRDGLLLSAGWVWHPIDVVGVYSLQMALTDPSVLDEFTIFPQQSTEIGAATFLDSQRLILATSAETFLDDDEKDRQDILQPDSIACWDIPGRRIVSQAKIAEPAGSLMALNSQYALGIYEHPKVFDLNTGEVVWRLSELSTGKQFSSIIHHLDPLPPTAMDPSNKRLAVATDAEIVVITFHCDD